MPVNENQEYILDRIRLERDRQDIKWGVQDHSDQRWLIILIEEVGEVARAMFEESSASEHIDEELTQSAAVIVAWLESRKRRAN